MAAPPTPPTPLSETIAVAAAQDRTVTVDGTTTTAHSLREQIEADKYLRGLEAKRSRRLPLRIHRIKPGGAV
jgi:hypothetical protein